MELVPKCSLKSFRNANMLHECGNGYELLVSWTGWIRKILDISVST